MTARPNGGPVADVHRLLLIQPRWMGDVLLCTPAVREARRAFPHATIHFLTEPGGARVLAGNRNLDDVLVSVPGAAGQWQLLRRVRGARYDAVVDFRSTGSTARTTWLSGAPIRVGTAGRGPRNLAYTHLVERTRAQYVARNKLTLLEQLGPAVRDGVDLALELAVGEQDRTHAARVWESLGLAGDQEVVALSPVARDPHKQWGAGRWARVADALVESGARVLLTHGPGEENQVACVVHAMRHPAPTRGACTPQQLAALFERAALWIGHDGGAKHIAVASGVPTLSVARVGHGAVWTDTSPGSPHRFVEGSGSPSDPRGGLDSLSPEQVLDAVSRLRVGAGQR